MSGPIHQNFPSEPSAPVSAGGVAESPLQAESPMSAGPQAVAAPRRRRGDAVREALRRIGHWGLELLFAWGVVVRRRWFLALIRDVLLGVALLLAAIGLDSAQMVWARWWPLPLAASACALTLALGGAPWLRWRQLGWIGLLFLPLALRALISLSGPLPAAALRESLDLALIFFCALSLWLLGARAPGRALALWLVAMGLGWLIEQKIHGATFAYRPGRAWIGAGPGWRYPELVAGALTLFWGLPIGMWLARSRRPGANPTVLLTRRLARSLAARTAPPDPALDQAHLADFFNLGAFGAGLILGLFCFLRQPDISLPVALALEAGLRAQGTLWIHSLLVGWGHGTLDRLIEVLAEPRQAAIAPWGGPIGLLALGGLAGYGLLLGGGALLHRWSRQPVREGTFTPYLARLAALPAFCFLGLILTGGPRAGLVLLALAGWTALALIGRGRASAAPGPAPPRGGFEKSALLPALTLGWAMLLVVGALALPTCGHWLAARGPRSGENVTATRARLMLAQSLDPFDPAIPMALAAATRATMGTGKDWSEMTYLRVVERYHEAEALDPYDTLIPLRLAHFQLVCDRQEEAIATARAGLGRRPHSLELMDWIFLVSMRLGLPGEAREIVSRALLIAPMEGIWWARQCVLASQRGQGPEAVQALAAALTDDIEDPPVVRAAWAGSVKSEK